jgi:hypothetical protein
MIDDGRYRYACEPAATVVRAFGGPRSLARQLGISAETCSQWNRPLLRKGTGGYIPLKYWDAILARRNPSVTLELLASGRREKVDVGSMSRRKGALFERQVVNDLKAAGLDAKRVPLSGAAEGYPGDVIIEMPTRKWILQCKISAQGGGRHAVVRMLNEVVLGEVAANGCKLLAMRRDQFVQLVKNGVVTRPVNTPFIIASGKQILNHLSGHDALIFRRSGSSEWMALLPDSTQGVTR